MSYCAASHQFVGDAYAQVLVVVLDVDITNQVIAKVVYNHDILATCAVSLYTFATTIKKYI